MEVVREPPKRIAVALENLAQHAVKTRLCPDTLTMQFSARGLPEWLTEHLEYCRDGYTQALRFQAERCIKCGHNERRMPKSGRSVRLFCVSCYDRHAVERWEAGAKTNADRKIEAGAKDALFAGIEDDTDPPDDLFSGLAL
jgi:hypothetical protein